VLYLRTEGDATKNDVTRCRKRGGEDVLSFGHSMTSLTSSSRSLSLTPSLSHAVVLSPFLSLPPTHIPSLITVITDSSVSHVPQIPDIIPHALSPPLSAPSGPAPRPIYTLHVVHPQLVKVSPALQSGTRRHLHKVEVQDLHIGPPHSRYVNPPTSPRCDLERAYWSTA
jgi:hypothetical protein